MTQELKHHHINELIGMTKLKGCIGYPIVYYANEVDAVVAKKDTKIQTLKQKLMAYGNTSAFLTKENTDLKIITESKDAEIRRLNNALDKERSETIKYMDELCKAKAEIERLKYCSKFFKGPKTLEDFGLKRAPQSWQYVEDEINGGKK